MATRRNQPAKGSKKNQPNKAPQHQPNAETQNTKKRIQFSTPDRVVLICLTIATILLAIVCTLERRGIRLIQTEMSIVGILVLLLAFVVWGISAIVRRFKTRTGKLISAACFGTIILIIGSVATTYASQFAQLLLPNKYSMIESESGRKAVVMQRIDTGIESEEAYQASVARMDARRDHILAEDPTVEVTEEDPYPVDAYGYVYNVYPVVAGIFFNENAEAEGAVYRGYASEAKILYEWQDGDTLRIYLENPEIGDEGENILHY